MFYDGKVVAVTGGSGFVGTHIIQELMKTGARVRAIVHERPMIITDPAIECVRADLMNLDDARRCQGLDPASIHAAVEAAMRGPRP